MITINFIRAPKQALCPCCDKITGLHKFFESPSRVIWLCAGCIMKRFNEVRP